MQEVEGLLDILYLITIRGLSTTLALTLISLAFGFVVGTALALMRVYGPFELQLIAKGYEKIFRGIPLLVLLFIFGAALLGWFMWAGSVIAALFVAAVFALALRSAAYQSELFRGSILSVDVGQMMAARSIGMTEMQATRHIILPQAFRLSLPGWTNEYAVVIKDSSLASAIGVTEMLYQAQAFTNTYPALFLGIILVISIIYFIFTYPITKYVGESMTAKLRQLGLGGGKQ
ncbi:MAG: polar amino acid ABC transporter permease [Candidatus Thorarchaeota archaeon]|nr:MAG: polar amino acid ABC transporter permease [Candidatus Thorarchaeota archaeon]